MTNNSTSSDPGDLLSGLFKYNEESRKVNNKGSLYGSSASLLNNPLNPLYGQFYVGDKLGQGVKNAWQKKDIGAFFNTNFYHFYGYKNLDKVWGGKNIKWVLDNFVGIDPQGNMSVGNFLLNVASIIPIGRVASLGVKFLPKAASAVMKSGVVQKLLKSGTVQTLLKGAKNYLIGPLATWGKNILDKIPEHLRNINLADIGKGIVNVSDLITLKPSTIVKYLNKTPVGKWISEKLGNYIGSNAKYYADFVKAAHDGPVELIKFGLEQFTKASPEAIGKLVTSSNFKKYLQPLTKIVNNPLYKSVQTATKSTIKRFLEISGVKDAAEKVHDVYAEIKKQGIAGYTIGKIDSLKNAITGNKYVKKAGEIVSKAKNEYEQIKKQGIVGYAASKIDSLKKAITDNKYVKTASKYVVSKVNNLKKAIKNNKYVKIASKIVSKTKHELKQIKKQGIRKYVGNKIRKYGNRVRRYVKKTYHRVYRAVKRVYHRVRRVARRVYHYVRPVVNRVVSVARNVYNGVSNAVHGFASWLGFRGPSSSSSNFISRASGFTYQGYDGSRQSISQTIASMSGNCVDGTLAQISLARSFGIPAEMITTTWNGNPHVYGRINGVDRDIANHALTGNWSRPPAGPDESNSVDEMHLHIEGDIYGPEFEEKVSQILSKTLKI